MAETTLEGIETVRLYVNDTERLEDVAANSVEDKTEENLENMTAESLKDKQQKWKIQQTGFRKKVGKQDGKEETGKRFKAERLEDKTANRSDYKMTHKMEDKIAEMSEDKTAQRLEENTYKRMEDKTKEGQKIEWQNC